MSTNANFANKLYRNDNGHFTDVSKESGITSNVLTLGWVLPYPILIMTAGPDVMVSNDFNEPDYLFINNRNGTFTESLKKCMDRYLFILWVPMRPIITTMGLWIFNT